MRAAYPNRGQNHLRRTEEAQTHPNRGDEQSVCSAQSEHGRRMTGALALLQAAARPGQPIMPSGMARRRLLLLLLSAGLGRGGVYGHGIKSVPACLRTHHPVLMSTWAYPSIQGKSSCLSVITTPGTVNAVLT